MIGENIKPFVVQTDEQEKRPEAQTNGSASSPPTTSKHWLNEGHAHYQAGRYDKALSTYDHAHQLDPDYSHAHRDRGHTLLELERYEEALAAYEQAIQFDPDEEVYYNNKGLALHGLLGPPIHFTT